MPFWLLVLILVALIALCWGGGYGLYYGMPDRRGAPWGGLLGLLGLVFFIVLVLMFVGDIVPRPQH
jgi:hypothetical protein